MKSISRARRPHPRLKPWWQNAPPGQVQTSRWGEIVSGDAIEALSSLRDEIAEIVFLDPPFNLGKKYGKRSAAADRLEETAYQQFLDQVLTEGVRVLRPGGSLYLYHIPKWAMRAAPRLEGLLDFRHWIAISMKNGYARGRSLYPAHYALLHFSKGKPAHLRRPKIAPLTCRHCGDYVRDYGGYKEHVERGINLSDVWDDLSPVRHSKYKNRKANELPLELLRRVVQISGSVGGLLVDPFAGTGTSAVAARLGKMKYIAIDREQEHCAVIHGRLQAVKMPTRKSGAANVT